MEMDVQDFFENLDFNDMAYFYHITGKGNGNKIMENGLYMEDSKLSSTLNQLYLDNLDDVNKFIIRRGNQIARNNDEMVIIGCYKEDIPYLVKKESDYYIISSENIIGYIEIDENNPSHTILLNPYYIDNFYNIR